MPFREPNYRVSATKRVLRLLDALPVHYRRVLELRFFHTYSCKKVAEEFPSTGGAVKVMQYPAFRRAAHLPGGAGGVGRA
jgi:DNA-directed RNA polymerase specialized sigma24 family protein